MLVLILTTWPFNCSISARVSATDAFQHCAKNNIQVHGGMGFTWAFDCHLYYRRSKLLALALGAVLIAVLPSIRRKRKEVFVEDD